jgi:4,5-epoxidase
MTEVLVVGAGPTGLTLACALRQQGVNARVIDRAEGPATTSRANVLHVRGSEVLDRIGALAPLRERAQSVMQLSLHLDRKPIGQLRFGVGPNSRQSPVVLPQSEVEAGLRARLAELGGAVEWRTELLDAEQDEHGVSARLSTGPVRAAWVAGCDGARSTVRELAGIDFPGQSLPEQWVLADVRADLGADRGGNLGWLHRDGLLFAMPMRNETDDLWRIIADAPADERPDEQQILDQLRHFLNDRTTVDGSWIREATWTSGFRIHRRLAEQYRHGRLVLAGDAAHLHSPLGGQGMNTGVGDAENLAWKLALTVRGLAEESLVDTYTAERRPLATGVVRNTSTLTRLALARRPLVRQLRDRLVPFLLAREPVQRRISGSASQLRVSYRKGPLGSRSGQKPRPGDRVPDLEFTGEDGSPTRLHAELRGRWALLDASREQAEMARKALGGDVVELTTGGPARLVRPDAHLAWSVRSGTSALQRWLCAALGPG